MAGETAFTQRVSIHQKRIVPPQVVKFVTELRFGISHVVLFDFVLRVILIFPDRQGSYTVGQSPFLPELFLGHLRVVVAHLNVNQI